jgi:hypothetical protein
MKFWRRNWYYIGGVLFVALAFFMGFWGSLFSRIQVILIFSFMAMLVHQFEEYAFPGGFPGITNIVMMGEKKVPDRYPLNANQCWISNVFLTYPFYIVPVFFPNLIWLGLAQVMLGMLQIIAHGIIENMRLKSLYNPGLGATVFLQLPLGIYFIWYVATNHLASTGTYILGFVGAIIALVLLFLLPIRLMASRESKYPFAEAEMYGFAKEKVVKIRNS